MKGFIKTIEAIIASLIILLTLYQFIFPYEREPWGKIYTHRELEDLISVASLANKTNNFVLNNDYKGFHDFLENHLPGTYDFSIVINGIPKPIIKVGCVCNQENFDKLSSELSLDEANSYDFSYDGRKTNIRLLKTTGDSNWDGLDVVVFFNKTNFTNDESKIKNFLKKGNGVVLISNMTDDWKDDIFAFTYTSQSNQNSHFNSTGLSYHISRVFAQTPFRVYTTGSESEQLGNISLDKKNYEIKTFSNDTCRNCVEYPVDSGKYYSIGETFTITPYDIYVENVNGNSSYGKTFADLYITNKTYEFSISGCSNVSIDGHAVVYNDRTAFATTKRYGNGYATWIADDYNYSDISELVKSMIMFTAGETYKLDGNTFDVLSPPKKLGKEYFSLSYFLPGYNHENPYELKIYVWHIFS